MLHMSTAVVYYSSNQKKYVRQAHDIHAYTHTHTHMCYNDIYNLCGVYWYIHKYAYRIREFLEIKANMPELTTSLILAAFASETIPFGKRTHKAQVPDTILLQRNPVKLMH
jgi:hypothetical protein